MLQILHNSLATDIVPKVEFFCKCMTNYEKGNGYSNGPGVHLSLVQRFFTIPRDLKDSVQVVTMFIRLDQPKTKVCRP